MPHCGVAVHLAYIVVERESTTLSSAGGESHHVVQQATANYAGIENRPSTLKLGVTKTVLRWKDGGDQESREGGEKMEAWRGQI